MSYGLIKLANEQYEKNNVATGIGLVGVGALTAKSSTDALLGRKTLYHGTSKENAKNILRDGFKSELGGTGAASGIGNSHFANNSKNSIHASSVRPYADFYATADFKSKSSLENRAKLTEEARGTEGELRGMYKKYGTVDEATGDMRLKFKDIPPDERTQALKRMEVLRGENKQKASELDKDLKVGVRKGKVLKAQIPYADYNKNFVHDEDGGVNRFMAAKTNENIPSSNILGGQGFSRQNQYSELAKGMPAYVKNHPGRFGRGALVGTAGLGLAGFGVKKFTDNTNGME